MEIELIRHYKGLGISYNLTNGGDGTNGYHHTDEYKQFKSQQMKEFFFSLLKEVKKFVQKEEKKKLI